MVTARNPKGERLSHPVSLTGNEGGFSETLAAAIVLSAVILGILSLEVVTRSQLFISVHAKRKAEFEMAVRQVSYSLSDPRTCHANLRNTVVNADLRKRGFQYYNAAGAAIGTFVGADGKIDQFELDVLRVTRAVPVAPGSTVHLAELEISGHYGSDLRVFARKLPIYLELAGGRIDACYVSAQTQKGALTVEKKTCLAVTELEAAETYGTTAQCEAYLVKKTIADGDKAASSLAGGGNG